LKRKLASEVSGRSEADWDYYSGGKGPFVAEILRKALLLSPSPPQEERGN
jgi:hypothetical protein